MKLLLFSSILLTCFFDAASQNIIGFKSFGSLTSASVHDKSATPDGPRLAYGTELTYQRGFTRSFIGSIGLNYNQRGYYNKIDFRDASNQDLGTAKVHFNLDYISLPIGACFRTGTRIAFFGRLALNPSLSIKSSFHQDPTDNIHEGNYPLANTKKFDFGALAEAGIGFPIGRDELTVSLTLQQSFTSFNSTESIVSHGLWLAVGYELTIGR